MARDFDKHPYSPDEERVVAFFAEKGIGGGDDPIGFLLTSHEYFIDQRNALLHELLLIKGKDQ